MKFGTYQGHDVELYVLENDYLKVEVMNLGACLVSIVDKDTQKDILLGFDSVEGYLDNRGAYIGMIVGRSANRIAKGQFKLNDIVYNVPVNNGPNSLHGGLDGVSYRLYDCLESDNNHIVLSYDSCAMEEGYPGNLHIEITYRLNKNELEMIMSGLSDADTIFNLTNHAYFNLTGEDTILDHELKIPASRVSLVDSDGLTLDEVISVENTAFDFTTSKKIRDNLVLSHPNIETALGYDHNYVYETMDEKVMAELTSDSLHLIVTSDLPGIHVYSGNYLDDSVIGKHNKRYQQRAGICFECQYYPNAINYEKYIQPILKANEKQSHFIRYTINHI